MLPGSDQQTDFFELSIRNLSSSENNIDGDTVIMTNIQGIIVRNIENHKIGFSLTNKWIQDSTFLYIFKGIGNTKKDRAAVEVCQNTFSPTKKYHQDLHFALCGDGINYVYEIKIRGVNKLLICSLYEEMECMSSLNETRDIQPRQKDDINSNFEYLKGKWSDTKVTEYQCFNVNKGRIVLNQSIYVYQCCLIIW